MGINRPPVWELDGLVLNGPPDANGVTWIATGDSDPLSAPAPSSDYVAKFQRIGSYWLPGYVERGTATLTIRAYAPKDRWDLLRRASLKMLALCQDTTKLYPLVFHSEIGNLVQMVAREGDLLIKPVTAQHPAFEASIQVTSPDPRRYAQGWQELVTGIPQGSITGLDFGAGVLNPNPTFDVNTTGWTAVNSATLAVSAPGYAGSANAIKVTSTQNTTASGVISTAFITGITIGAKYRLTTRINPSTAGTATLLIDWFNSGGSLISSSQTPTASLTASTWSDELTIEGVAPATATQAKLRIQKGPIASGAFFLVDNLELRASASGLDFGAGSGVGGLDFGPSSASGTVITDNTGGTAPTPLIMRLTGPLTTPVITTAGGSIQYNDTLTAGAYVDINPEDPSVLLGGTASRGYLANPALWSAFIVQPGQSLTVGLSHSGAPTDTGTLRVRYRPAFW